MDTWELREVISQEDEVNHINDALDYLYEIQHNIVRGLSEKRFVNEALIHTKNLISKMEERKELKTKRKELNVAVTSNV